VSAPATHAAPREAPSEAASPAPGSTGRTAAPCCEDLQSFYNRFRAAALATDVDEAASLTRFPLEVRGGLDDSTSVRVTRNEFARYFRALLDADTEESERPLSGRESFAKARVPDPRWIAGESFRVANFQFENRSEGWRLAVVYSDSVANDSGLAPDSKH
jgi:hypothetical protein